MADLVEVRVRNNISSVWIPVNASAISFQLFGSVNQARLVFCEKYSKEFMVLLGELSDIVGIADTETETSVGTPYLSLPRWFELWISWNRGVVRVGMTGESAPFIQKRLGITYTVDRVLIGTVDSRWRFYFPPHKPIDNSLKIESEELRWVPVDGKMPPNAVIGGHENEPLYVIRGLHRGSVTPGKMSLSSGAFISWGGDEHKLNNYEVLVGTDYEWVWTSNDHIPYNAVVGGRSENPSQEELYIGRVFLDDHLLIGKVQRSLSVCYVPYRGKERSSYTKYEVMVQKGASLDQRLLQLTDSSANQSNALYRNMLLGPERPMLDYDSSSDD